jgi:ribosome-binding protein aMBF1 (putative translation factor)
MTKRSELKTAGQITAKELVDPEIRREHERTALARAVAMRVIGYRVDHGLSQTGLAHPLGMQRRRVVSPSV